MKAVEKQRHDPGVYWERASIYAALGQHGHAADDVARGGSSLPQAVEPGKVTMLKEQIARFLHKHKDDSKSRS